MAQILSQEEIDALREAVKSGEGLDEGVAAEESSGQVKVVAYNFRRPQIMSGDQFHSLRLVHETFANTFRASLFAALKTNAEINMVAVDQMTYGEFVLSASNPTYLSVLTTNPNVGNMEMEFNLSIVTSMVDILLGGDGSFSFENRGLTALERDIVTGVMDSLMADLKIAWTNIADVTFAMSSVESNPEYIQLTRPETPCVSVTFDVHLGKLAGVLTICYPSITLEGVFAKSEERSQKKKLLESDKTETKKMKDALDSVPLDVRSSIGPTRITAQQVMALKPGDIIDLNRRISKPVDVYIESQLAYAAEIGQYEGKTAVCLLRPRMIEQAKKE